MKESVGRFHQLHLWFFVFSLCIGYLRSENWAAGKTVITSDHALKLEFVPDWIVIVGSGYIGLEFSDVYTALGSEVIVLPTLTI